MTRHVKITGTRYVLAVIDLGKSADFYKNRLGFTTIWSDDNWHFIRRDNCTIMLGECPDDVSAFEINNHAYFAYLEVKNIEVLYKELVSKKVEILSALEDMPWGQREFAIRTIDGHRLMIGEEITS